MTAIRRGVCVATERSACPLIFNAAMTSYYSPIPEGRAFGATHDAYSCKWLGTSHAHPEHTSEDMQNSFEGNQMGSGISRAEGPAKSHSLHTALL